MEFTVSFPVPGAKGCDQSPVTGNQIQIECPNKNSSHQGFESNALYDVGDATKPTLLQGFTSLGPRHLIGCKRQEDGLYSCSASLLTASVLGDPDSFIPRAHVEWKGCQSGSKYGAIEIVCSESEGTGIGQ